MKDHGDGGTPDGKQLIVRHLQNIPSGKQDLARLNFPRRGLDQVQNGQGSGCLPSAGLSYQTQRLASIDGQVNAVDLSLIHISALIAAEKGHSVVLCEARDKLGGALKFADNGAPNKLTMKRYRDSQIRKVLAHPEIEVRLNTTVDASVVDEVRPDVLIAAVGGRPVTPPIPGVEGDNVFFGADLMPDTPLEMCIRDR